jgi:ATP-dependent Zn protease
MDIAGQYTADINGQTGQYVVKEPEGQIAELTSTPTTPAPMEAPLVTSNPTPQESTSVSAEQSIPTSTHWWVIMLGVILPIIIIVGLFAIFRHGKSERETK